MLGDAVEDETVGCTAGATFGQGAEAVQLLGSTFGWPLPPREGGTGGMAGLGLMALPAFTADGALAGQGAARALLEGPAGAKGEGEMFPGPAFPTGDDCTAVI